ncbi:Bardet-Biedl syndrome 4-like, partial [Homarus americanus]
VDVPVSLMNPVTETPESHVNGMTTSAVPPGSAQRSKIRPRKAPELQTVERRNWLIHLHYVRKEFDLCKQLIREQLEETRGMCEYANYVQNLKLQCKFRNMFHLMDCLQAFLAKLQIDKRKYFPENGDLHTALGLLYMQTGKHQQAFEHLGTTLTFDANNTRAILAAGSMMQSHQDFDVALAKYRVAAQSIAESPPLWNNISMCFFGKKKYVAAISCLKRANYLAPFDWKILYNLGLVHLTMQQYTSAFHFLSAAVNLRPTKGHIFMLLAISLTYLDDEENARQAYEQAITLEERDPSVIENGAKLASLLGVDGSAFRKKASRTRLDALDETMHLEKMATTTDTLKPVEEVPRQSPPPAPEELNLPETSTGADDADLVSATQNLNINEPPAFDSNGNGVRGELLASAHLQFQEEKPKEPASDDIIADTAKSGDTDDSDNIFD